MTRLVFFLLLLALAVAIIVSCDDFSHDAIVNTPPINFVDLLSTYTYGEGGHDWGNSLLRSSEGTYFVSGSTNSRGYGPSNLYFVIALPDGSVYRINWFGGWGEDLGEDMAFTSDNALVMAGVSSSFDLETGDKIDPNSGKEPDDWNFYLVKADLEGNPLWEKAYGDSLYYEWGNAVAVFNDGYMLAGYRRMSEVEQDILYVRTDLQGREVWQMTYGSTILEGANDIVRTSDGGFVMGGYTREADLVTTSPLLVKISVDGAVLWANTYGAGAANSVINCVIECANGDIIGVGYSAAGDAVYVLRTDNTGAILWEKTYAQSGINEGTCVLEDAQRKLMICGQNRSSSRIKLLKLDAEGTYTWADSTGAFGSGMSMVPTPTGYAIAGSTALPDQTVLNDVLLIEVKEDLTNIPQ